MISGTKNPGPRNYFVAIIACLGVWAAPVAAKAQTIVIQSSASPMAGPHVSFDLAGSVKSGIDASNSFINTERRARQYNAQRQMFGDAIGPDDTPSQLLYYRQHRPQMIRYIQQQQYYSPAHCQLRPQPVYNYRGVFVGYRQVQVCY